MLSVGYLSCVPLGTAFSSRHPSSSEKICLKRSSIQKTRAVEVRSNLISEGNELILQGFNWDSYDKKPKLWNSLETQIPEIAKSGFSSVWLPPSYDSFSPQGYTPHNLYSLNTRYGSEDELRTLLRKMKQYGVRSMADIVINHRCGTTKGHGGLYNRFDGIPLAWDEHAVTSSSGGLGNPMTDNKYFPGFPNIDHTKEYVRNDIVNWLRWLRYDVGFEDFRFDFVRGFSTEYVKEYIERANPLFSVGEYWNDCDYQHSYLDYNQDSHRQEIINWIDGTGQLSTAFDFTTKGILQEAVKGEFWRLRDAQGKPPGVMGWWASRSVTFLDNHDTGSSQNHWSFPQDHIMEGYAYILTHPGVPTVFWDHYRDNTHMQSILKLINIRKGLGIKSTSAVRIIEAKHDLYSALIDEKLSMKIGEGSWYPGEGWTLSTSGHNYAVWHKVHWEIA